MLASSGVSRSVLLSLAVAVTGIMGSPTPVRADINALVPAYFYPAGSNLTYWNQLDQAAQTVNVDVIVNPASGPGTVTDSNYLSQIQALNATLHGRAFGYIATGFGTRPVSDVEADIQRWITLYANQGVHLAGFFVDEMFVHTSLPQFNLPVNTLPIYQDIYGFIKNLGQNLGTPFTVIGNPGNPFLNGVSPDEFLSTADTMTIFEGPHLAPGPFDAGFNNYPYGQDWFQNYPRERFANIIFDVPADTGNLGQSSAMLADLNKAIQNNAGSVFITDGTGGNPYDHLPSYWDQEVAAITSVPEPGALAKLASGGLFAALAIAVRRRTRERSQV